MEEVEKERGGGEKEEEEEQQGGRKGKRGRRKRRNKGKRKRAKRRRRRKREKIRRRTRRRKGKRRTKERVLSRGQQLLALFPQNDAVSADLSRRFRTREDNHASFTKTILALHMLPCYTAVACVLPT